MNQSPVIVGIIPARLASSRLPEKLLLAETGKTLLQHTWESASRSSLLSRLLIATDSDQIARQAQSFGAECQLTGDHPSGTDRIAEVVRNCCHDADLIVNIQGDEPEIDPNNFDELAQLLIDCPSAEMATLATPIREASVLNDPSCVKVVCAADGRALYFSRSTIPFCRDGIAEDLLTTDSPWLLHLGIYAYRREFLMRLTQLPPSRLEQLEKLEQLRALEAGARIQVAITQHHAAGIDTREDYDRFVARTTAGTS